MSDERINRWSNEIRVLDGGIGSECQKRSTLHIDGHKAWSCRLLKDDPNLVCDVHKSYIRAGADVISTNTYQAAPHTLSDAMGISIAESEELMRHAVRLVRRAISAVSEEEGARMVQRKLPILVAGSLGPYGACQADGSEYTGSYTEKMSLDDLVDFHLARAKILVDAGVDFIAWETIPALAEVSAICEVMRRLPGALAWLSVASQNGQTLVGGDPLHEVALTVETCNQIFAIGVNCCIDHDRIGMALSNLDIRQKSYGPGNEEGFHPPSSTTSRNLSDGDESLNQKFFIVYANSGERWVPSPSRSTKRKAHWIWPQNRGPASWAQQMRTWSMRRQSESPHRMTAAHTSAQIYPLAQWVGGCCRVTPSQIRQLAEWMKPDEFLQASPSHEAVVHKTLQLKRSTAGARKRQHNGTVKRRQPHRICKKTRSG